jgi:hypothetical protein
MIRVTRRREKENQRKENETKRGRRVKGIERAHEQQKCFQI